MPPLLADFIHTSVCKPICAKLLTLPNISPWAGCLLCSLRPVSCRPRPHERVSHKNSKIHSVFSAFSCLFFWEGLSYWNRTQFHSLSQIALHKSLPARKWLDGCIHKKRHFQSFELSPVFLFSAERNNS